MNTIFDRKEFIDELTKTEKDLEDIFPGSIFSIKGSTLNLVEEGFILRGGTENFNLTIEILIYFDFELDLLYPLTDLYKITFKCYFEKVKVKSKNDHISKWTVTINEDEIKQLNLRKQILSMVYNDCE